MNNVVSLIFAGVILAMIFAGLGYYVAEQKGRNPGEGLLLGLLFGPLGCLVEALLPATATTARPSVGPRPRSTGGYNFGPEQVIDVEEEEAARHLGL